MKADAKIFNDDHSKPVLETFMSKTDYMELSMQAKILGLRFLETLAKILGK